jgi:hypothetical protein
MFSEKWKKACGSEVVFRLNNLLLANPQIEIVLGQAFPPYAIIGGDFLWKN